MRTPSPEPFFRTRYMEFACTDISSLAAGFYNPNHAAAAICALFPFCCGWRGKGRWAGRLVGVTLCVMLAMTYSRTGMMEAAVVWWRGALGSTHPTSVRGRRWNAVPTRLCVYRDEGWSLKSVAKRFPDGARFCIRPGVPEDVVDAGEVWPFGDASESAWRFKVARLKLVDPPEFFDPPTNAVVVSECSFRQD